jgi:hypothetical protein
MGKMTTIIIYSKNRNSDDNTSTMNFKLKNFLKEAFRRTRTFFANIIDLVYCNRIHFIPQIRIRITQNKYWFRCYSVIFSQFSVYRGWLGISPAPLGLFIIRIKKSLFAGVSADRAKGQKWIYARCLSLP